MKTVEICGDLFESAESVLKHIPEGEKSVDCHGNACADIEYEWDDDTNSYHFFNEGDETVKIVAEGANYMGCNGRVYTKRKLRPGREWDSRSYSLCEYTATYV